MFKTTWGGQHLWLQHMRVISMSSSALSISAKRISIWGTAMVNEPLIKPRRIRFSMFCQVQRLKSVSSATQNLQKRYRVREKRANLSEIKSCKGKLFLDRPDLKLILAHAVVRKTVNRKDSHRCQDQLNFHHKSCQENLIRQQVWKKLLFKCQNQQTQMWKRYWWRQFETTWKN